MPDPTILKTEQDRIAQGCHTSRCYLMRKYQMTDADAREALKEILGDDRQSSVVTTKRRANQ